MVRYGAELPIEAIESQIANAIDLVVQIARYPNGDRGICELRDMPGIRIHQAARWRLTSGVTR